MYTYEELLPFNTQYGWKIIKPISFTENELLNYIISSSAIQSKGIIVHYERYLFAVKNAQYSLLEQLLLFKSEKVIDNLIFEMVRLNAPSDFLNYSDYKHWNEMYKPKELLYEKTLKLLQGYINYKHLYSNLFIIKSPIRDLLSSLKSVNHIDPQHLLRSIPLMQLKSIFSQINNITLPKV